MRLAVSLLLILVAGLIGSYGAAPYALPQKLQYDAYLVNNHPFFAKVFAGLAYKQDTWQPRQPHEFNK